MLRMTDFSAFVMPHERAGSRFSVAPYVNIAQRLEDLGFYSVALPHVSRQTASAEKTEGPFDPFKANRLVVFDPLLLAPILATATKRLRFGLHSAVLPFLHPYHWARFFAVLDVMTGGRIDAGMCIGGVPKEFAALGVPINQRGKIADESLELIKRLWVENDVTYTGGFFRTEGTTIDPKPVQNPHPPIWWGGRTAGVPRAARSCQYILVARPTPRFLKEEFMPRVREETKKWGRKLEVAGVIWAETVLDGRGVDRDVLPGYHAFGDDLQAHAVGSPERVAQVLRDLKECGMSHFMLDFNRHGIDPLDKVKVQAELFVSRVLPLLAA